MALKGSALRKWKRKEWIKLIAPKYFGEMEVGSTPADDPEKAVGRTVEIRLSDLTKDSRHKNIKVFFKVERVQEGKGFTKFFGHELDKDYVERIVRGGKSRVDVITDVKTKDEKEMRVKSLILTAKRVKTSQKEKLRKISKKTVKKFASENAWGEFVYKMLVSRLAKQIRKKAHKIYPLSKVEIRKSEV